MLSLKTCRASGARLSKLPLPGTRWRRPARPDPWKMLALVHGLLGCSNQRMFPLHSRAYYCRPKLALHRRCTQMGRSGCHCVQHSHNCGRRNPPTQRSFHRQYHTRAGFEATIKTCRWPLSHRRRTECCSTNGLAPGWYPHDVVRPNEIHELSRAQSTSAIVKSSWPGEA